MSTQAASAGAVTVVEDSDTYISSDLTEANVATLPEVDDGSADTVAVGAEIRFECTGGLPVYIESFDGRLMGICPGRRSVVVTAVAGAQESEDDLWSVMLLPMSPATTLAAAAGTDAAIIDLIAGILVSAGLAKAE